MKINVTGTIWGWRECHTNLMTRKGVYYNHTEWEGVSHEPHGGATESHEPTVNKLLVFNAQPTGTGISRRVKQQKMRDRGRRWHGRGEKREVGEGREGEGRKGGQEERTGVGWMGASITWRSTGSEAECGTRHRRGQVWRTTAAASCCRSSRCSRCPRSVGSGAATHKANTSSPH